MMDALYVPFSVEAYVTNGKNQKEKEVSLITPDYARLKKDTTLGGNIDPSPFERTNPLKAGVHLHFILPDALTHAVLDEDGTMQYPKLPNRWLVTRFVLDQNIKARSFVIESDYLGLDNVDSITIPYLTDPVNPYRRLGRCYPCENPPIDNPNQTLLRLEQLSAIGPGDPTFAAYYPNCSSVLGFHDSLEDLQSGNLTYSVIGFFEDESEDPLYGLSTQAYQDYLTINQWTVVGGTEQATRTIYHGMLSSVSWKGPNSEYDSNTPTGVINAAIGNNSVEALSTLISAQLFEERKDDKDVPGTREESQVLERFLTAMQYELLNKLDEVDGIAEVEDLVHKQEFDPKEGKSTWEVRLKENNSKEKAEYSIPKGTGKLLNELNQAQEKADSLERSIYSKQQELFGVWQRLVNLKENPPLPWNPPKPSEDEIVKEIKRLCEEIDQQKIARDSAINNVEYKRSLLEANIAPAKDYIYLELKSKKSFSDAKDPVILLGGNGIRRPFAFGEDGRFIGDGTLECRLSLIDGLLGDRHVLELKDILSYCELLSNPPEEFYELLEESVCLSPEFVQWIAQQNQEAALSPKGLLPSPIAYGDWEQSWVSLFLEWSVQWGATRTGTQPDDSMNGWSFDTIDFTYTKNLPAKGYTYMGRTILTPYSTLLLQYILEKNMERFQEDEDLYHKLEKALAKVKDLSVLSQQLSGLWIQLASMRHTLQLPIIALKDYEVLSEQVSEHIGQANELTMDTNTPFLPIRAGFMQVNQMNIINTFGIREVVNSTLKKTWYSEELCRQDEVEGMFPPRFVQGARVEFDWISEAEDQIVTCIDPDTSPVCGFLYPDLLNHNLAVYEADGTYKGNVKMVYRDKSIEARFISAPGEPSDFEQIIFRSRHIKSFLQELLRYNEKHDPAFYGLMNLMEQRINETCADCESEDFFSMLGRPFVLVRARVKLELNGDPLYAKDNDNFAKQETYDYEQVKIPVYIGDLSRSLEGSVGIFPDGDEQYQKLHCVYHAPQSPLETDYLRYNSPIRLTAASEGDKYLTLLMEAGASVSVRTGIVPEFQKSIPPMHVEKVLNQLDCSYEISPIVSDENEITLPLYSDREDDFFWYHRQKDHYVEKGSVEQPVNVFKTKNPIYMEGYLQRKEHKE